MKTCPEKTACILAAFACAVHCAFAAPLRIDVKPGDSLTAVRDRVRALSAAEKSNGVEVVLADGEYVAPDYGIEFTAADGCIVDGKPVVVWRAEHQGKARIVGAARIPPSSFAKVDDPALLARLPEDGRGKVYAADVSAFCPKTIPQMEDAFNGLPRPPVVVMDGRLGTFAAYPNGGNWMSFTNRVDQGTPVPGKKAQFTGGAFVCEDPRPERWDFSKGVWLNGYFTHDWHNNSVKAASYGSENGTKGVLRIGDDTPVLYGIMSGTWGAKERRFKAFNIFEELDEPGEWWLDREKKILYVVPFDGKMSDSTDIRLAFSERPIICGGGSRRPSGIRFDGLAFCFRYGGFVNLSGAESVTFSGCSFNGCIKGAIVISGTLNVVSCCEISQCGGGGVEMSGGDRKNLARCDSAVEGCKIHDFGIFQRTYAGGAHLNGCGLVLRECEIFNAPHTAVFFSCNDSVLESNDVHHVLLETGDAGAFYTGRDWTTQGNVLRYNFVHDLGTGTTSREGADAAVSGTNVMGFYFDDCDCGDEVYGNVFLNVPRGIMVGGGRDHPVRNNVFINCNLGLSIDCRGIRWKDKWNIPGGSWHFEGKAQKFNYTEGLWAARYPRLANIMNDHPREPLYNPVEGNTFIDCGEIIRVDEMFKYNDNGTAPGIFSRMAPMRNNTVIYTKCAKAVKRQKLDKRIADGFRILDCSANE